LHLFSFWCVIVHPPELDRSGGGGAGRLEAGGTRLLRVGADEIRALTARLRDVKEVGAVTARERTPRSVGVGFSSHAFELIAEIVREVSSVNADG
jgi:hypothetical protein